MEISIIDKQDDCILACSSLGIFWGIWRSSSPPELKSYIVELDTDDIITPELLTPSFVKLPYIESRDGVTYLTGLVERIEDDVLILRLYETLMMIQIEQATEMLQYCDRFVCIGVKQIQIYDVGII